MEPESHPTSCASAIKACDPRTFPNLSLLVKITCSLPVTSCECECSCSVLRRLSVFHNGTNAELSSTTSPDVVQGLGEIANETDVFVQVQVTVIV